MTQNTDQDRAEFELMRDAFESKGSEAYKTWLIEVRDGDSYKPWDVVNDWRNWQTAWKAARRAPAVPVPQDVEKLLAELTEEIEATDNWRRLALQFDGHRMQAIGHLKAMLTDPKGSEANALEFIKAAPLNGEAVLAQRIAALAAAPQPPEAALVPSIAVTPEMVEAANEAYCPFGDMELALCAALQVAPIPPGAAPVQLPENIREGEPYDNPAFEALARALGVWGTAQSAVCAQFWIAAKEQST